MSEHTCKTCVYERDSSPSQHCDGCVDGDCWRAAEPIKCPCEAHDTLIKHRDKLLAACKGIIRYNESAEKGQLSNENGHEYWMAVIDNIKAAIEGK